MPRPSYNPQQESRKKSDQKWISSFNSTYGFPIEKLTTYFRDIKSGKILPIEEENKDEQKLEEVRKELGLSIPPPLIETDMLQQILTEFNELRKSAPINISDKDILSDMFLLKFNEIDTLANKSIDRVLSLCYHFIVNHKEERTNIINDMFSSLSFENKILLIVYDSNEPDNVLEMNKLYKTWPEFEKKLKALLEIHQKQSQDKNQAKQAVNNIKKLINDYTIDKNQKYVWDILDAFLIKWTTKRFEKLEGIPDDMILQMLRYEFAWIKSYTDKDNHIQLFKTNHILFPEEYVGEQVEDAIEEDVEEETNNKYINRLRYFPYPPLELSLLSTERFLYQAKTPFLNKNGRHLYFPFEQVTPLSAKSLKSFLLKVIKMVGYKTFFEAKLQPYLSVEDTQKMYQLNLTSSLEGGLNKVYELLQTDADIIKETNIAEAYACTKNAVLQTNMVKTGLQRRTDRTLKTLRHYEDKKYEYNDVYEECKKISSNVVVKIDVPDDHDVYIETPVQDSEGNNYYKPKLSLQNELCSRETILKEGQDGIWTEDGTQYLLGKYIDGKIVTFNDIDYHSLFPIQQISLNYKYSEINEVHKHIIHDTLYKLFTNKPAFTLLYTKLTSSSLSMLQLLYIFYCIVIFKNETFQLYDELLFTSFQEKINQYIDSIIAHDGVILTFFNVMLSLTKSSLEGNGAVILNYISLFINQCIKDTFPFFVMRNDKYPCLPIFINVSMIKNLPENSQPIPAQPLDTIPYKPTSTTSVNSSMFKGTKERSISHILLCECGSNEKTIPTIRFVDGLPDRIRLCSNCLENFSVS